MPKLDEVERRHVFATTLRHGGAVLGHATHRFTCVGVLGQITATMSGFFFRLPLTKGGLRGGPRSPKSLPYPLLVPGGEQNGY
jgi:hypothetical protein